MEREKDVADLKARIERLEKLAQGFSVEEGRWKGDDGLLLFRERKAYLGAVQDALAGGYREVYDADLKGCFDTIPHEALMKCLERRISDRFVLQRPLPSENRSH